MKKIFLDANFFISPASFSDCYLFLSSDKKLLKLKFFGKVKIQNKLT